MPPRWITSFRSSDFRGDPNRGKKKTRRPNQPLPPRTPAGDAQGDCARGDRCAARTRDPETGAWHPAPAAQPLCPTDRTVLIQCISTLPGCYERLGNLAADPVKSGRTIRTPPGSRVLASPEADALMRTTADTVGAWAARVRAIPQLSLTRHAYPHGSAGQVTGDCTDLARHPDPLLALPPYEMTRIWTWPAGSAMPGWLDEQIGDLDACYGGDGWIKAFIHLSGRDAALELIDLRHQASRLLQETPPRPEYLDGVPCRSCEVMALAVASLPAGPPSGDETGLPYSRCQECGHQMTRTDYDTWVGMYGAWARGAGILVCHRCDIGLHGACFWKSCGCAAAGHDLAA
jgi:hypothetical protein